MKILISSTLIFGFIYLNQVIFSTGQIVPGLLPPDNTTCTGVVSGLFRKQLRHILICTRQLNLRAGHSCVLKCAMIREGVLTKEGEIDQKLLDEFIEKFPGYMQQRVLEYVQRCQVVAVGKADPKEETCKSYEPLYRCVVDAIVNFCGHHF